MSIGEIGRIAARVSTGIAPITRGRLGTNTASTHMNVRVVDGLSAAVARMGHKFRVFTSVAVASKLPGQA